MPLRVPMETIVLRGRGATAVKPVIGKPFDFTKTELENIMKINSDAVRPLTETESAAYAHNATTAAAQNKTVTAPAAATSEAAKTETAKERKAREKAELDKAKLAQQQAAQEELAKSAAAAGTGQTGDEDGKTGDEDGKTGDEDI